MAQIDDDLAALATMSPAQLRSKWRQLYRASPPDFTPDLLRRGIAWRLQERFYGGLPAAAEDELRRLATELRRTGRIAEPEVRLKPGTRLIRGWKGRSYLVEVKDDGYHYDGRRFTSLTPIAREITGTNWSGPRFFGVKARPAPPKRGGAHA